MTVKGDEMPITIMALDRVKHTCKCSCELCTQTVECKTIHTEAIKTFHEAHFEKRKNKQRIAAQPAIKMFIIKIKIEIKPPLLHFVANTFFKKTIFDEVCEKKILYIHLNVCR